MGLDFDVLEFCKKLRQNRPPPYQCPLEKCDKVYKSLCGLQYHLVNYDHDNPTPTTPAVAAMRKKHGGRARQAVPTADIALMSPPKEALTFAEAQKVVQFEIDGKISKIPTDQPLPIMSLDEWEKWNAELEKPMTAVEPIQEPHVKLPEASYQLISDYNERIADAPPRPNGYIRFIEKSAEELDGEVEYDVDEEDTAWLEIINKMRVKQGQQPVSVDTLELLMDRLEKESYFQAAQTGQQTAATVDEDAVCCICMDGECQNTNVILFCDMCNLAVHQDCYGVPYIPEGQWLCRRCLQSPSRVVNCVLCPNTGGAFKQTDQSTWAHVVCALWIPEVRFANTVFLEPIDSIEMIPPARWKLQCMVCKQRGAGACIQCHNNKCYSAFHVTCAQQAGLYMKMEAAGPGRDPSQPVQVAKMAYCDAHTPAHVLQERKALESEGDTKNTDLSIIRQKGREKIKQARRVLALKRSWSPVVLVPTLPASRVSQLTSLSGDSPLAKGSLLKRLLPYWTLKRHHRNGVPLLRRLQSQTTHHGSRGIQEGSVNVRELCNQLKYWQRIRQDLERARLLCELVRKRERLKAEYTRVWERCVMHTLRPEKAIMHKILKLLQQKDTCDIFCEPVDPMEVPDYSSVVKHPMDLSTMVKKLDKGAYKTIDDIEDDFTLMIDNCLAYNNKDTVFYKAGIKMRDQCMPILMSARQDCLSANMSYLCGDRVSQDVYKEQVIVEKPKRAASVRRTSPVERESRAISVVSDIGRTRTRSVSVMSRHLDTDDDAPVSPVKSRPTRGRGRAKGRPPSKKKVNKPTQRVRTESPQSGSESRGSTRRVLPDRTVSLSTPEPHKSPKKNNEKDTPVKTGLGLMGGLRKPTLLLTPTVTPSIKSFGSDATLPTLSSSLLSQPSNQSPQKKGRGRPKKQDKKTSLSNDLFGLGLQNGEDKPLSNPVPASFLQYRGPPGEVGSDSDLALSRSSSNSTIWSQSCSSCTHYDDMSEHSCSYSSDRSSDIDTMESGEGASEAERMSSRRARDINEPSTPTKGRGTRSSTSRTPVKSSHSDIQYEPLQLVWAKCRGYPWYPALIIDPKMPKGYIYNGVPLPVPPTDVLNLKKNFSNEPTLYLVLFFDVKRTWQWLPPAKLEPLGLNKSTDQSKMVESRKPADRKAVKKAFQDAMQFRKQVDGQAK